MNKELVRYSENRGFGVPFVLVLVGVWGLLKTPSPDELAVYSGGLKEYDYIFKTITLANSEKVFHVSNKSRELINRKRIKNSEFIVIWVVFSKEGEYEVKQLKVDEEYVFKYNYWKSLSVGFVFTLIGLILVPVVIRAKIKQRQRESI